MEFQVANPSSIVSEYCRLILPLSKSLMNYIMHIKFLFHAFCIHSLKIFRAVCLAVSGVNHPNNQQRILDWLRDIFPSHVGLYVKNDAVIALASGTMGKLHDGGEARAVSAGPVLGDWGSGCGIAAHALTIVIKAHDGRGAQIMLVSSILESIGLSSPDELIKWTYANPSWAHIVALHKHLYKCMPKFVDLSFRHLAWNSFND
ncbi:hypothetical protein UlMin_019153 [Ulmus minor]